MKSLKERLEDFISKSQLIHNNKYDYSKINYINSSSKVEIICPEHGPFWQTPNSHVNQHGCPKCGKETYSSKLTLSLEDFINRSKQIHDNKYDYSKVVYLNSSSAVEIICPEHGPFWQTPNSHIRKHGCQKCGNEQRKESLRRSNEEWIELFKNIHNGKYEYRIINNEIIIICPHHGEFTQDHSVHASKHGCPKCGLIKSRTISSSNTIDFTGKAIKIHSDKYNYSKVDYRDSKDKVTIVCNKHGEFTQRPNSHLNGQGCPKCGVIISKQHQDVLNLLPNGISVINNDRDLFDGLEIDIFLPNEKIGIEINGTYWHGLRHDNRMKHDRLMRLHNYKSTIAEKRDIKLFQFWDFEINSKPLLIKSMIYNSIGLSNRIYARKCDILELDNKTSTKFFEECHLQGHRNASVTYGLSLEDKLQCVLSFSKHKEYDWEIIRFSNQLNTNVVGGFSKLLNYFIKKHKPKNILTFADRRISQAKLYLRNNFNQVSITKPNYFYCKQDLILSRQQCQKHKLLRLLGEKFNPELSESENMLINGFSKVYDAGHIKLLLQ